MSTASDIKDTADRVTGFVEGTINTRASAESIQLPTFRRMVVLDTISDPTTVDQKKVDFWANAFKPVNSQWLHYAPRNSVIAKPARSGEQSIVLFPFFPSHLALPCKAGECVWAMVENYNEDRINVAYWFCKVPEIHINDDVNHAHPARGRLINANNGTIARSQNGGEQDVWYEMRNGFAVNRGNERYTDPASAFLYGSENVFEQLITETDASKITQYEAVPRFRKRPGDLALEGSNNTLIVLGTDRTGPVGEYVKDSDSLRTYPINSDRDFHSGSAGSIDIVAGRGQTTRTFGSAVATTSIFQATVQQKGVELKKELEKNPEKTAENEGDPDFLNDRSRILVAQKTSPDINFGLSNYNRTNFNIEDDVNGDSAIVIKSDKVRLIARSDLQILVKNFEKIDASTGNKNDDGSNEKIKDESLNEDNWASITVKANGDIVFTPSRTGFIKLGGDDANKGIVCSDTPVTTDANGNISGKPLITTMGGQFAGSSAGNRILKGSQAQFANKVLIK